MGSQWTPRHARIAHTTTPPAAQAGGLAASLAFIRAGRIRPGRRSAMALCGVLATLAAAPPLFRARRPGTSIARRQRPSRSLATNAWRWAEAL